MKFGDRFQLKIDDLDRKGRGCGLINGRKACVHFTAPGEEIEAELLSRRQGVLNGRLIGISKPSPRRVTAPCPDAGRCGGCQWQNFEYGLQLELKRRLLEKSLTPVGLMNQLEEIVPCPETLHYRNRMDYCVGPRGEIGLKEPGRWNAYLDLKKCLLLAADAPQVLAAVRDWMRQNNVQPWDGRTGRGYLRYVVIREGKNTGERLVTVVTKAGDLPDRDGLTRRLAGLATSLLHGINDLPTDLSLAQSFTVLRGEPILRERVGDRTYLIPPNSFFQTNTLMAGRLLETVGEFLGPKPVGVLLDLYCGVGFFGLGLAQRASRVVGVEIDAAAIETARRNAAENGVANAEFFASQAESLIWKQEQPEVVIVDPPRSGLHPKVIATLLANRPPRIIYVSCNHEAFSREFAQFAPSYAVRRLRALDLFPHSPHVELVALFEQKGQSLLR